MRTEHYWGEDIHLYTGMITITWRLGLLQTILSLNAKTGHTHLESRLRVLKCQNVLDSSKAVLKPSISERLYEIGRLCDNIEIYLGQFSER